MSITPVSYRLYEADFPRFAEALGASFERYGFAVLCDHPVPQPLIDEALADTKAFFALPTDVKRKYRVEGGMGQRGYIPFGIETAKGATHHDLKEFWHVGRDLPAAHRFRDHMPENVWPDAEVPGFHPHLKALYDAIDGLGNQMLRAIARHLKLDDGFFEPTVEQGNSILRLLHYPPVPEDGPHVRAGAHEDINVITLLLGAEEAGLELKEKDGSWLPVNPPAGSIVVNIGDMLQRLTNHRLPSTSHRVVNPAPERRGVPRYSTPFFLHFASDYMIETLPQTVDTEHPDRYPEPITADGFLKERLREIKLA